MVYFQLKEIKEKKHDNWTLMCVELESVCSKYNRNEIEPEIKVWNICICGCHDNNFLVVLFALSTHMKSLMGFQRLFHAFSNLSTTSSSVLSLLCSIVAPFSRDTIFWKKWSLKSCCMKLIYIYDCYTKKKASVIILKVYTFDTK